MNIKSRHFETKSCPCCDTKLLKLSGDAYKIHVTFPLYYCVKCSKIFRINFKEIKPEVKQ